VDHQVKQLLDFGLKAQGFFLCAHGLYSSVVG
jgi:hypothetical protein